MAKMLITGPGGTNYRLPADTELSELRKAIEDAMEAGDTLTVDIQMSDDPTGGGELILNGKTLPYVGLIDLNLDGGQEVVLDVVG